MHRYKLTQRRGVKKDTLIPFYCSRAFFLQLLYVVIKMFKTPQIPQEWC
jgi:hypothetical protein